MAFAPSSMQQQALRLERCARRFRMNELAAQHQSDSTEWRSLAEPLYLFLSSEKVELFRATGCG
jgi:hypothetical protein